MLQVGQRAGGSGSGRASNNSGRASIKSRQSGRSAGDYHGDSSSAGISQARKLSVTSKHTESQSHTPDRRALRHAEAMPGSAEPFRAPHPGAMDGGAAARGDPGVMRASTSGMPTLRQPPEAPEITAYVSSRAAAAQHGGAAEAHPGQRPHGRPRSDPAAQASHPETSHDGTSSSFLSNTSWNMREAQRERERGARSMSAPRPGQSSASGGIGAGTAGEYAPQAQAQHAPRQQTDRQRQRRRAMQHLLSEGEVSDYTETPTSTRSRTPGHRGTTWSASIWDSMPHHMEPGAPRGGADGVGRSPVARGAVQQSSRSWTGVGTGAHALGRQHSARAAEAHAAAQHAVSRSPSRGLSVQGAHVEVEDDPLPRGVGIGMPKNLRAALHAAQMEAEETAGQRRARKWY